MTLPNDVARCLGEWSSETYGAVNCSKRGTCARYTMRDTGGERTPFYASMCPGKDGYYQHYIEVTHMRCAMCGRVTLKPVMIGAMAIGPTCARKSGLLPQTTRQTAGKRQKSSVSRTDNATPDLFEDSQQ